MAQGQNDPPEVKPDPRTQAELDEIRSAAEKAADVIGDVYDTINQPGDAARTMGQHGSRIWAGVQALGLAQGNDTRLQWNKRVNQAYRVGQIAAGWTPEQIEWSEGKGEDEDGEGDDEMGSGNVSVHGDTIINVSPEITRNARRQKPAPSPKPESPPAASAQPGLLARLAGPALIAAGLGLGGLAIGAGIGGRPAAKDQQVEGYSTIRLFSDEDAE